MTSNFPDDSLDSYESFLKEIEQLVKNDPGNKKWQHDLSICHIKIGNLQQAQGNHAAAMTSYMSALNVMEQLANADPANTELQYEMCRIYDLIGNIYKTQDDLNAALKAYASSLRINERLEKNDRFNKTIDRLSSTYGNMQNALQCNRSEEAGKNTSPPLQNTVSKNVNFAVSFPSIMVSGGPNFLEVWLFLDDQRNMLRSNIQEKSKDDINLKSEGPVGIERGTMITARLTIENLIVAPPERYFSWTGHVSAFNFYSRGA